MSTRIQRNSLRLVSTVLCAAVLMHRGAEAAELKICVDKSSPAVAMDIGIANAVGALQGQTTHITRFDGLGDDDDDGLPQRTFRKLANSGDCQLIMGYPVDAQKPYLPDGVKATLPYAHTGFVLVTRKHAATSLEQLPKGSIVALTYLTAPNLYFSSHPDISPEVFKSDAASLQALRHGEVTAAMLWRPFVAHHLHDKSSAGLQVHALAQPHAAWNLVALFADEAQPVAAQFERAIEQLRQSGRLEKLEQPYADADAPAQDSGSAPKPSARLDTRPWPAAHLIAVSGKGRLIQVSSKNPPALYTDAQAQAGKLAFQANCAVCHGPNLEGRAGPALKGTTFATPAAHFSVGDIFQIVSQNMPAPAPGTLPHDDYVNIMAFLLQQNGYPAGSNPLVYDSAGKSKVKLIYRAAPSN